jgi:hypothetical protein
MLAIDAGGGLFIAKAMNSVSLARGTPHRRTQPQRKFRRRPRHCFARRINPNHQFTLRRWPSLSPRNDDRPNPFRRFRSLVPDVYAEIDGESEFTVPLPSLNLGKRRIAVKVNTVFIDSSNFEIDS